MKVIDDNFMVCTDCIMVIANGEMPTDSTPERDAEIIAGIKRVGLSVSCGDSDKKIDHSINPCDCCHTHLHGERHHCVIMEAHRIDARSVTLKGKI